jgi:hypothetical protein
MRDSLLKRRELLDLLSEHADALNDDTAVTWLADHPSLTAVSSILALFQLAQAVKRVLVPVPPSPIFQAALKKQLAQSEIEAEEKRPFPRTILLGAAVSAIGLAIFLVRRLRLADDGVVTAV